MIENDTSYNLLLGWVHGNFVVPSTFHQCFKYVDEKYKQNSLRRSEAGVEAYCADSKLYDPASGDKEEEVISASRKAKKSR